MFDVAMIIVRAFALMAVFILGFASYQLFKLMFMEH